MNSTVKSAHELNKEELASYIALNITTAQTPIHLVFTSTLEKQNTNTTPEEKERLWQATFPILQNTMASEIYHRILQDFEEIEVLEMLQDCDVKKEITNQTYLGHLRLNFLQHKPEIESALSNKLKSLL